MCIYNKKLISMEPDDITHRTFFKKLQIILTDLPSTFNNFEMKEDVIIVLIAICLMNTFFI